MLNPLRFLSYLARYGRHPAFCQRLRRPVTIEWIMPFVESGQRVLEIGAGDGQTISFLARRFPTKQFVACEQNKTQIERLRARCKSAGTSNVTVVETDFREYAQDRPFDLVYAVDVLEHVADDFDFLLRIREMLRPGGNLFLHVPAPGIAVFEEPDHVRPGYEQDDLKALLEKAGFEIRRMGYTFGQRGLCCHHSRVRMSRLRRMIVHLLDLADDNKVRSEIGVIAARAEHPTHDPRE